MRETPSSSRIFAFCLILIIVGSSAIVSVPEAAALDITTTTVESRTVTLYAPAVAQTDTGLVGTTATISVTVQPNGTGLVFVDTMPLTNLDMQGSARIAARVACQVTGSDMNAYDFFFVIRSGASVIGGPSAGGVMAVAAIAALNGWEERTDVVMTGMINPDWSIGPVGGIFEKAQAAANRNAALFLVPEGQSTIVTTEWVWTPAPHQETTTLNLTDYAREHWGMTVVEVSDVRDAVRYFTGYEFDLPPIVDDIATPTYKSIVRYMATDLMYDAERAYAEARNHSTVQDNQTFGDYYTALATTLNDTAARLADAVAYFEDEQFYTASSKAFQALYLADYVSYALQFLQTTERQQFVTMLLSDANAAVNAAKATVDSITITSTLQLECFGAAQQRISMAEDAVEDGIDFNSNAYTTGDYLDAVYQAAYAEARAKSALVWINVLKDETFEAPANVSTYAYDEAALIDIANEYILVAQEIVTYADLILTEAGLVNDPRLASANALLERANHDMDRDYTVAAILEALQAEVNANIALQLYGDYSTNLTDKIEKAQRNAAQAVSDARALGFEPVLAISDYEFGDSLAQEGSMIDALAYTNYARTIAHFATFVVDAPTDHTASRFVGHIPFERTFEVPAFAYYIIGLLSGLLVLAYYVMREEK